MLKVARAYTLTAEDCQDLAQERLYAAIRQLPKADAALVLLYW